MVTVTGFSSLYEDNPLAVWAAVGATVILAPLSTFLLGKAAKKAPAPFLSASAWRDVTLLEKRSESPSVRRLMCGPDWFHTLALGDVAHALDSRASAVRRATDVHLTAACSR